MELLDSNDPPEYALQCIKWCAENVEIAALKEHLKVHRDKLKDELLNVIEDAVSKRQTGVVKVFLDSLDQELGNIYNKQGKSLLQKLLLSAIEVGDTDIVKEIIDKGANVNGSCYGKPLIHLAACYGHTEIVTELVKAGGDICSLDNRGEGIIHSVLTSQFTNKEMVTERVISLGADPLVKSSSGKLPIHVAAKFSPGVLTLLLDEGQDVNTLDDINKETPLHIACGAACRETIQTLIRYGSRFNIENNNGQTPLAKLLRFTSNDHDFHAKTRLNIAKQLISIGFQMPSNSQKQIKHGKGRDKCRDRYSALKMSFRTPARLQSLARLTVRESLRCGYSLKEEIDKFDIPLNLKAYLMFHDFKI